MNIWSNDEGGVIMAGALIDNLAYDSEEMKLYLQEKLILEVTECIADFMQRKGIKKSELAKKLDKTKGYITQLLNGRANMTLRTVADVMWALDCSLTVDVHPLGFETRIESGVEYDLPSEADFWGHIRLLPIQQTDVTTKEREKVNQLKLAG